MDKRLLIHPDTKILDAMAKLEITAEKVLIIIDNNTKKLLGTLSDGDIRRYILKDGDIKANIKKVFNSNCVFVRNAEIDEIKLKKIFTQKKIDLIPVLDESGIVIDTIIWSNLFKGELSVKKTGKIQIPAVIMAGGKGTRLEPFTKVMPKPLIPINEKPIIEHIIYNFKKYGVNEFHITVNYLSEMLEFYFRSKEMNHTKVSTYKEKNPLGTAGSLLLVKSNLKSNFFVSNCDILVDIDYSKFYEYHLYNDYDVTIVASLKNYSIPYGVCELNKDGTLNQISEKPEYNHLVNTGFYLLKNTALDYIPQNKIFHMTDLIDKLNKAGGKIGVYPISEESWKDVGQWADYRKTLKTIIG